MSSVNNFPKDLRVLVYAKELNTLEFYAEYLKGLQYKVTASSDEKCAMYILREHKNMFDIAFMVVKKPDGYIYQTISQIDLPIIIVSDDDSVESVTKWMTNGASDYLVIPLKHQELELIYKNVVRVRRSVVVTGENVAGEESSSGHDDDHASTSRRKRLVWDQYLRTKFRDAMNYLGNRAVPKKILEHMNCGPDVTRTHVASYLQKYRQNEKKKKKNESTSPEERQEAAELHGERNVQFETPRIAQPFLEQPYNLTPHHPMPSFRPNHDEASISIANRNFARSHQEQYNHQTTDFSMQRSLDDYNIGRRGYIWETNNMDDVMSFFNGCFCGHDTVLPPFNTNFDRWHSMMAPGTDSVFNNNSGQPHQNNNSGQAHQNNNSGQLDQTNNSGQSGQNNN